jgi:hypothetical protein
MLRAVARMAIEAAKEAERMLKGQDKDRRRIAGPELRHAQDDGSLAERRDSLISRLKTQYAAF